MGRRRSSRRRKQPRNAAPTPDTTAIDSASGAEAPSEASEPSENSETPATSGGGYGKAALLLALLLGTLLERVAATALSGQALDVFHLAMGIGIAFLVARWYRRFMRRTLTNARANRQDRKSR